MTTSTAPSAGPAQTRGRPRAPAMSSARRTSLVAGVFYLLTFVSLPTLLLYRSALKTDYLSSAGSDTPVLVGTILEVVVALAGIGTAITLFPVVRRQNEAMALGFVASRTLEAAMLFTAVASIRALVSLRQDITAGTAGDPSSSAATAAAHVADYEWAFTLGGSLMPAINALLLGTLLYRSGLVPRALPALGLLGVPFHLTAVLLTMLGAVDRVGVVTGLAAIPIALWELSLGIYLVTRGFKPSPVLVADPPPSPPLPPASPPAAFGPTLEAHPVA